MRFALLLACLSAPVLAQTAAASASLPAPAAPVRLASAPALERLAQRQPGGLPGVREGDEEAPTSRKGVPGGLPGRAPEPDVPLTRSLQAPKPRSGPEPSQVPAGKKATSGAKKETNEPK
jgi:hypothetical protein